MRSLQFYFVFYSLVLTVYHLSLVFFIISLYFTLLLLIIFYFTFCFLLCLHLNLTVLTLFGRNIWLSIWNCFFCLPNCFANSTFKNTVQLIFIIIKITSKLKQSVDSVQQLGRFLGRFRSFPIELKAENYSWSEPVPAYAEKKKCLICTSERMTSCQQPSIKVLCDGRLRKPTAKLY